MRGRRAAGFAVVLAMLGCTGGDAAETSASVPLPAATTTAVPPATAPSITITVRLERLVDDPATAGFAGIVVATLADPRGWARAGFVFTFSDDAPYTIVLAEGPEVDARCAPYNTAGRFSCQLGPVVVLNADRWRTATPEWTAELDSYRQMLVNHEIGHLLGQHHPTAGCTTPGASSPIMVQQSTNLDGCLANPWPLDWEIVCAAARLEPIAPGHEDAPTPLCGPDGPLVSG